jgi:AraC-like DNA-binding protein
MYCLFGRKYAPFALLVGGTELFDITLRTTADKSGMHTHHHNAYELVLVLEGRALFTINGRQYRAQRGSLLFINNRESHMLCVQAVPYGRCYALIDPAFFHSAVPDPVLASVFRNRPESFSHMAQLPSSALPGVLALFSRMQEEREAGRDYWLEAVKSCLVSLMVLLYRHMRDFFPLKGMDRTTEAILAIQRRIEERSAEPFTLAEAAKSSFIDMHHLSRRFKAVTGFTFQQYQILQRIARAKELLCHTGGSVAKIGTATGFPTASHFIRIFRKTEGVTPGRYRKLAEPQSPPEPSAGAPSSMARRDP